MDQSDYRRGTVEDSLQLAARLQSGDDQAAEELFRRYVPQLLAIIRRRLSSKLARRIDAEDVAQSAYCAFFDGIKKRDIYWQRSGDLWRVLMGIAANKLKQEIEFHTAGKRSIGREDSVRLINQQEQPEFEMPDSESPPDELAAVAEELATILSSLMPMQREIVEMRLQGESVAEIASRVSRSERHVRRELEKLRFSLERNLNNSNC